MFSLGVNGQTLALALCLSVCVCVCVCVSCDCKGISIHGVSVVDLDSYNECLFTSPPLVFMSSH